MHSDRFKQCLNGKGGEGVGGREGRGRLWKEWRREGGRRKCTKVRMRERVGGRREENEEGIEGETGKKVKIEREAERRKG